MKLTNNEMVGVERITTRAVNALIGFARVDDDLALRQLESLVAEARHFALCVNRDRYPDEDEAEYQEAYEAAKERWARIFIN
jgi:hypothetical protein